MRISHVYRLEQDWHKVSKPVNVRSRAPNLPAPRSTAILSIVSRKPSSVQRVAHHGGSQSPCSRSRLISSFRLVRDLPRLGAAESELDWGCRIWNVCAPRWADQVSIRSCFMRSGSQAEACGVSVVDSSSNTVQSRELQSSGATSRTQPR